MTPDTPTASPALAGRPAPPLPAARHCALFLDFDGTLADIAAQPQAVALAPELLPCLQALVHALDGAVAVVTGRPVAQIDALLAPLHLPVAGVHGAERRSADGRWHRLQLPPLDDALAPLRALCGAQPALLLEEKPGAVALHYRQAPALEAQCLAAMRQAQQLAPGMVLLQGKCVIELKPRGAGKDAAVTAFLAEPPFRGRRPWVFGDDVTDEAAFDAVQSLGGVAVKVGEGPTRARHALSGPAAVRLWLQAALQAMAGTHPGARA